MKKKILLSLIIISLLASYGTAFANTNASLNEQETLMKEESALREGTQEEGESTVPEEPETQTEETPEETDPETPELPPIEEVPNPPEEMEKPEIRYEISSDIYLVNNIDYIVSRIDPKTNIENVKAAFDIPAEKVHIYKDNTFAEEVQTGYVGTGMQIKCDGTGQSYTISVIGDIDGNGLANQIELSKIIKHIVNMQEYELKGIDYISADITGDDKVDQRDVTALIRYIVFGDFVLSDVKRPKAPSIDILTGTEGENGWYTSDVEVQITPRETEGVVLGKTTYTILGNTPVEETTIAEGETITLGEGVHQIICYTYSEDGVKSLGNKKTIQIDKTAPELGTFIMRKSSSSGEDYTSGSWVSENIYVRPLDGKDTLSGYAGTTYEITGATVVTPGIAEEMILQNQGTSNITVTAKDKAGNTATQTYVVNIDKTGPEASEIKMNINNAEGETYLSDTWTNQNVYVAIEILEEMLEGTTVSYKVEGANTVPAGTIEPSILQNEGESVITLTITTITGQTYEKKYTVKIDKTAPTAGTMIMKLNTQEGTNYQNASSTNQNVWVMPQPGTDALSGHDKTTYEIQGANVISAGTMTENLLTQEGISKIIVTTTDKVGNSATREYTVKIDKTAPTAPNMAIISGDKTDETSIWYTSQVVVGITKTEQDTDRMTYTIEGPVTVTETNIQNNGTITLLQDGVYVINAYSYDEAGNRSEPSTITIYINKQQPQAPSILAKDIQGMQYTLQATALPTISGVKSYAFYVDGYLYQTIETDALTADCIVTEQTSGIHNCYVILTDQNGKTAQSETIQVQTGRLSISQVDHIEVELTSKNIGTPSTNGNSYIISDTSVSTKSKYIQLDTVENGITQTLTGRIKLIRTDGQVVTNFVYYPEELKIDIAQYVNGSGSTWSHVTKAEFLKESVTQPAEGNTNTITILVPNKSPEDNTFILQDSKTNGTRTYTRMLIQKIYVGETQLPFSIVDNAEEVEEES